MLWLVDAAEARGDAAGALDEVARLLRARLLRAIDRCTTLVTPAAELAVGIAVFLLVYAFLTPLIEFSTTLMKLTNG